MTGSNSTAPSFAQRQPIAAAGGITAVVGAILLAFWALAGDAGWLTFLQEGTKLLLNNAILIIVGAIASVWAQRKSTSTAAPQLTSGTQVAVKDDQGNVEQKTV